MDMKPTAFKRGAPKLSRNRATDDYTPGWDSKTEAQMDARSPLRNPALAQECFERRRALRLAWEARQAEGGAA